MINRRGNAARSPITRRCRFSTIVAHFVVRFLVGTSCNHSLSIPRVAVVDGAFCCIATRANGRGRGGSPPQLQLRRGGGGGICGRGPPPHPRPPRFPRADGSNGNFRHHGLHVRAAEIPSSFACRSPPPPLSVSSSMLRGIGSGRSSSSSSNIRASIRAEAKAGGAPEAGGGGRRNRRGTSGAGGGGGGNPGGNKSNKKDAASRNEQEQEKDDRYNWASSLSRKVFKSPSSPPSSSSSSTKRGGGARKKRKQRRRDQQPEAAEEGEGGPMKRFRNRVFSVFDGGGGDDVGTTSPDSPPGKDPSASPPEMLFGSPSPWGKIINSSPATPLPEEEERRRAEIRAKSEKFKQLMAEREERKRLAAEEAARRKLEREKERLERIRAAARNKKGATSGKGGEGKDGGDGGGGWLKFPSMGKKKEQDGAAASTSESGGGGPISGAQTFASGVWGSVSKSFNKRQAKEKKNGEEWVVACPKTRIAPGQALPVVVNGIDLLIIASRDAKRLYCVANECPHLGTPLETGLLEERDIPKSVLEKRRAARAAAAANADASSAVNKSPIPPLPSFPGIGLPVPPEGQAEQTCEDCIVCPLHNTAFVLETGEVRGEWCPYPPVIGSIVGAVKPRTSLPTFSVRARGKNVEVRINSALGD